jgi:hypothetical protein
MITILITVVGFFLVGVFLDWLLRPQEGGETEKSTHH